MEDAGTVSPSVAVLIAEDEVLLALEIEDLVRSIGCTVVGPAGGVAELLALVDRMPFDVALLDVCLRHGENVYAVVDRLRVLGIPFVFMTAYDEEDIDPRYADTRVICKPFSRREIESCLAALVASKAQQAHPSH